MNDLITDTPPTVAVVAGTLPTASILWLAGENTIKNQFLAGAISWPGWGEAL